MQKEGNIAAPILVGYLVPYIDLYIVYNVGNIYTTKNEILGFKTNNYKSFCFRIILAAY